MIKRKEKKKDDLKSYIFQISKHKLKISDIKIKKFSDVRKTLLEE